MAMKASPQTAAELRHLIGEERRVAREAAAVVVPSVSRLAVARSRARARHGAGAVAVVVALAVFSSAAEARGFAVASSRFVSCFFVGGAAARAGHDLLLIPSTVDAAAVVREPWA